MYKLTIESDSNTIAQLDEWTQNQDFITLAVNQTQTTIEITVCWKDESEILINTVLPAILVRFEDVTVKVTRK